MEENKRMHIDLKSTLLKTEKENERRFYVLIKKLIQLKITNSYNEQIQVRNDNNKMQNCRGKIY